MRSSTAFAAVAFIVLVVGVSLMIGFLTPPGEWYAGLAKPAFNPPGWVFAPVWSVLYLLIAIAGWRIWQAAPRSAAFRLWVAQMVLNWAWSPAFFGAQAPWLAFAIILLMLASILGFMFVAGKHDRLSPWLFAPYAAWVSFASVLNGAIAVMN